MIDRPLFRLILLVARLLLGHFAEYQLSGAVYLALEDEGSQLGCHLLEPSTAIGYPGLPNKDMRPINLPARLIHALWTYRVRYSGKPSRLSPLYVLPPILGLEPRLPLRQDDRLVPAFKNLYRYPRGKAALAAAFPKENP